MTGARSIVAHALLLFVGCGSPARPGPPGPRMVTAGATTSRDIETTAAGTTAGEARGGAAAAAPEGGQSSAELGGAASDGLVLVDETSGDTKPLAATSRVFLPPTERFFVFDRAGAVGKRRFALDSGSLALMTFDSDGTHPSDVRLDEPVAAVALGNELDALVLDAKGELVAVAFDDQLNPLPGRLRLSGTGTGSHALAASADRVCAVWSMVSELHGRLFDAHGAIGGGFDFGPRSCGDQDCTASALWDGERFSVLWSRTTPGGDSLLSWGSIDERGAALSARNVLSSKTPFRLVGASPLRDGRVAVLLTLGSPAASQLLLFVDGFGTLENTLHVYQGATEAWGLASDGASLLIAARSIQRQGLIRKLDLMGNPLTDWQIADDSGSDTSFEPRVALFADGASYSAVVRMTDGSSAILDLD